MGTVNTTRLREEAKQKYPVKISIMDRFKYAVSGALPGPLAIFPLLDSINNEASKKHREQQALCVISQLAFYGLYITSQLEHNYTSLVVLAATNGIASAFGPLITTQEDKMKELLKKEKNVTALAEGFTNNKEKKYNEAYSQVAMHYLEMMNAIYQNIKPTNSGVEAMTNLVDWLSSYKTHLSQENQKQASGLFNRIIVNHASKKTQAEILKIDSFLTNLDINGYKTEIGIQIKHNATM